MKALVYLGPKHMEMQDVPTPKLESGEVLIQVAFSGICGSELSGFLGHNSLRRPPQIFGHEFTGIIVDAGSSGKDRGLRIGMRVTANPLITCGKCSYCSSGNESLCTDRKLLSAALPGSNAEYVKVPADFVYPLPDHVSLEMGALTEPVACGVRIAELACVGNSDTVLIMGMGPIGLFALQAVRLQGAKRIIAADLSDDRLAYAASLGAETINPRNENLEAFIREWTAGKGVDAAIDAVGATTTRQKCLSSVASGGKIVLTGLHDTESILDFNDIVRREIRLSGSFAYSKDNFMKALDWISSGNVGLGDQITVAPMHEGSIWFEKLTQNAVKEAKVLLNVREV